MRYVVPLRISFSFQAACVTPSEFFVATVQPFVPCNIEALAVRYTEAKPAFDSLLSRLLTLFPTPAQESALGAALQAAYHLLEETGPYLLHPRHNLLLVRR